MLEHLNGLVVRTDGGTQPCHSLQTSHPQPVRKGNSIGCALWVCHSHPQSRTLLVTPPPPVMVCSGGGGGGGVVNETKPVMTIWAHNMWAPKALQQNWAGGYGWMLCK